jgi:dolichol-phosphate mannosyltransferase
MTRSDVFVSAVAIASNHASVLPLFLDELASLLAEQYTNHEVLVIDNGSTDETESVVRQLLTRLPGIRYLRLTRATDRETAVMAGLDAAIGDFVVTLDPDLDPPQELVAMIDTCRMHPDLVLGVDQKRHPNPIYRWLRPVFHSLTHRILGIELPVGETGYRVISRQAVNTLITIRVRRRYFAVVAADAGLRITVHPYARKSRTGRPTAPGLIAAARTGIWVLFHNSLAPLRIASIVGVIGSFLSLMYSLYVVVVYLASSNVMPGWTTLSLATSGLFFAEFLILTFIGEYLGRLTEEASDRPLYHVRHELSSAVLLTDLTRRNVFDQGDSNPLR